MPPHPSNRPPWEAMVLPHPSSQPAWEAMDHPASRLLRPTALQLLVLAQVAKLHPVDLAEEVWELV